MAAAQNPALCVGRCAHQPRARLGSTPPNPRDFKRTATGERHGKPKAFVCPYHQWNYNPKCSCRTTACWMSGPGPEGMAQRGDDEAMTCRRLRQIKLFGPAGFASANDGEVIGLMQQAFPTNPKARTVSAPEGRIEGPMHQGRFDVSTGKALCARLARDLAVQEARLAEGRVWVIWRGTEPIQAI